MIRMGDRKITYRSLCSSEIRCNGNYLKTLKRDNFSCVKCGKNVGTIVVHHLDGNVENNSMSNLTTVCKYCHADLHGYTISFNKPKISIISELRNQGLSYTEIGEYLGITRQRVHQLVSLAEKRMGIKIPRRVSGRWWSNRFAT